MAAAGYPHPQQALGATATALRGRGPDLPASDLVKVHLAWNEAGAQTHSQLARRTGLTQRQVQRAVEQLRVEGAPICTNTGGEHPGVWLTQDPDVLLASYRQLRARALHQLANLRRMQRTAEAMRRPWTLWDRP